MALAAAERVDRLAGPIWSTQHVWKQLGVRPSRHLPLIPSGDSRTRCRMRACSFLWPPSVSLPPPIPGTGTPGLRFINAQFSNLCVPLYPHPPPELVSGAYTEPLWASDVGFTFAKSPLPRCVVAALCSHPGAVSSVSCGVCSGAGNQPEGRQEGADPSP